MKPPTKKQQRALESEKWVKLYPPLCYNKFDFISVAKLPKKKEFIQNVYNIFNAIGIYRSDIFNDDTDEEVAQLLLILSYVYTDPAILGFSSETIANFIKTKLQMYFNPFPNTTRDDYVDRVVKLLVNNRNTIEQLRMKYNLQEVPEDQKTLIEYVTSYIDSCITYVNSKISTDHVEVF